MTNKSNYQLEHVVNSHIQVVGRTIAHSERANDTESTGIAWPYPLMKAIKIPNILPTKTAVIAGLSGHGKTQMLTSIINGHSEALLGRKDGIHVHFSLEDPVEIYGAGSLSRATSIPASVILSGKMTDQEKAKLKDSRMTAAMKPVWIVGNSTDPNTPYVPMRRDTIEEALYSIAKNHPIISISLDYLNLVEGNSGYSFDSTTATMYEFSRWFMGQELKVNGAPAKILMAQADPNVVSKKSLAYPQRDETSNIKATGYLADFFVATYRPYTQYKDKDLEMRGFPRFQATRDLFFLIFEKVKNGVDNHVFPMRVDWKTGLSRIDTQLLNVDTTYPDWREQMEAIRDELPERMRKFPANQLLNISL